MYRCLDALLEIHLQNKTLDVYKASLEKMYTNACVTLCQDIIERKVTFHGLHFPGLSLEGFDKHQLLLEGYAKVHQAKEKYAVR